MQVSLLNHIRVYNPDTQTEQAKPEARSLWSCSTGCIYNCEIYWFVLNTAQCKLFYITRLYTNVILPGNCAWPSVLAFMYYEQRVC